MTSKTGGDSNDLRRQKKLLNAVCLAMFNPEGWTQLSDQHFRRVVDGVRFDYWPSTGTVEWRGRYYRGVRPDGIEGFIRNREDQ
jgi:hypothetical protein